MQDASAENHISSRDLYFRLLSYVRPYWKQFSAGIVFMVLLALTEPAIPFLLKPMLDGTFVDRDPEYLLWSPIALMVLFVARGTFTLVSSAAFAWVSGKLVLDLRQLMFERILSLPTAYFDAHATGIILTKVTNNVTQVTTAATKVLMVLVRDSVTVIGLLVYMLYISWKFTLLMFVVLPILVIVVRKIADRLRRLSRGLQATVAEMTHSLEEAIRGHKIIKVFGGRAEERERFDEHANWVRRFLFKVKIADAASIPMVEGIAAIMIALLIYFGTGQLGGEPMSVGTFVSFLAALALLFPPIKRLTRVNQPLQSGLAGAESVFGLLDQPAEKDDGVESLGDVSGKLEFRKVSFKYSGAETNALNDISFTAEAGKTIALVGPSGSGKTTIASLVPKFYEPSSGKMLIDDIDIHQATLESIRNNIAYVGQESILFNDSVASNIAYGRKADVSQDELENAARAAHALEFIQNLPQGFDTLVGEDGLRLSGGQRQRIAIARAILKDAPILILDEATSALDTESERHVQAALQNLTRNRTTLVIAHRLSTIVHADKILVIKDGSIVEEGTHDELIDLCGHYKGLYEIQFAG